MGNLADGRALDDTAPVSPLGTEGRSQNVGRLDQGGIDVNKPAGKAQAGQKGLHDGTCTGQQRGSPEGQRKNRTEFIVTDTVVHENHLNKPDIFEILTTIYTLS